MRGVGDAKLGLYTLWMNKDGEHKRISQSGMKCTGQWPSSISHACTPPPTSTLRCPVI